MFAYIAREKLQLTAETVDVWTENDGFLVDEDEILMLLTDEPLMILVSGQSWTRIIAKDGVECQSTSNAQSKCPFSR